MTREWPVRVSLSLHRITSEDDYYEKMIMAVMMIMVLLMIRGKYQHD